MNPLYKIGIDLGGTGIKAAIFDSDYTIIKKSHRDTNAARPYQLIIQDMAEMVTQLLNEMSIPFNQCESVGIGSPGLVNPKNGIVMYASNLNWEHVPLASELNDLLKLPVRVSNDANCAVYGEVVSGAAKGCENVVMLTLGTGIGGGIVSNGVLQEGGSAGGFELGHTLLVMDGEQCSCGRRGCIEAYASATALIREAGKAAAANKNSILAAMSEKEGTMNGKIPFDAAKSGCAVANKVIDTYIHNLGEFLVDCVNIWRPEVVLIGGGLSHEGDSLINPLSSYVIPRCFGGEYGSKPTIKAAALGNDAGLIGAAAL